LSTGFQDHFSEVAGDYARYRPTYPDSLFDHLEFLCPDTSLAWDCGAGSGQASVALASRFRHVLASDMSHSQISRAPQIDNVCYHLAQAEVAAIPSVAVDLVTVAQALHWFPHREFFAEVRRVLKPDGIFAAWCYTLMSVDAPVDPIIHQFYYDIVGPYWPLRRGLVEDAYRSLEVPFVKVESPEFYMEAEWSLQELVGYLGTWSAVRSYRKTQNADPRHLIAKQLADAWKPEGERKKIRWPLHVLLGKLS
jgi:ubiquinone/menaquinone biosynthesis C-methylase UbiE